MEEITIAIMQGNQKAFPRNMYEMQWLNPTYIIIIIIIIVISPLHRLFKIIYIKICFYGT